MHVMISSIVDLESADKHVLSSAACSFAAAASFQTTAGELGLHKHESEEDSSYAAEQTNRMPPADQWKALLWDETRPSKPTGSLVPLCGRWPQSTLAPDCGAPPWNSALTGWASSHFLECMIYVSTIIFCMCSVYITVSALHPNFYISKRYLYASTTIF